MMMQRIRYTTIYDPKEWYVETYPFVDHFKLHAIVNKKSGVSRLRCTHHNMYGEEVDATEITCIHTMVLDMTPEEYKTLQTDPNAKVDFSRSISIVASNSITLLPQEHFFALKSFAEGIALANMEAFQVNETDVGNQRLRGLLDPIFQFVISHDDGFLKKYFETILNQCYHNGKIHLASYMANLSILLRNVGRSTRMEEIIAQRIIKDDPPIEVIGTYFIYLHLGAKYLANLSCIKSFLHNIDACKSLESAQKISIITSDIRTLPEYRDDFIHIFNTINDEIIEALSRCNWIADYPEVVRFFTTKSVQARVNFARNQNLCKYDAYRLFFSMPEVSILSAIAGNVNAVSFPEFRQLFDQAHIDILSALVCNFESAKVYREEFRRLFHIPFMEVKERLVLVREFADMFDEYGDFFFAFEARVRDIFMQNPKSMRFQNFSDYVQKNKQEYILYLLNRLTVDEILTQYVCLSPVDFEFLIEDDRYARHPPHSSRILAEKLDSFAKLFDPKSYHLQDLAANEIAARFPEYAMFFEEKLFNKYKKEIEGNSAARLLSGYVRVKQAKRNAAEKLIQSIRDGTVNFEDLKLFSHESIDVRVALAESEKAALSTLYVYLVTDRSIRVKKAVAANTVAAGKCDRYSRLLFSRDRSLRKIICANPVAQRKYATYSIFKETKTDE